MTVEDVAAAIIHQTDPETEATGKDKPRRKFVDVQTQDEKREEMIKFVTANLPKTLNGPVGEFKVVGIAETIPYRHKTYVYLKLAKADGTEPIREVPESADKAYEAELVKLEKSDTLAKSTHKIELCLRREYWKPKARKSVAPKAPKTKAKTETKAGDAAAAQDAQKKVVKAKKEKVVKAPF